MLGRVAGVELEGNGGGMYSCDQRGWEIQTFRTASVGRGSWMSSGY